LAKATGKNIYPTQCLALEDSLNGVLAAKAARMLCIAIPEPEDFLNPKFQIAEAVLGSLEQVTPGLMEALLGPDQGKDKTPASSLPLLKPGPLVPFQVFFVGLGSGVIAGVFGVGVVLFFASKTSR
jgi:hypothetical protein